MARIVLLVAAVLFVGLDKRRVMRRPETRPANVGNLVEMTLEISGSESELIHEHLPGVGSERRWPDVACVGYALGWEPKSRR